MRLILAGACLLLLFAAEATAQSLSIRTGNEMLDTCGPVWSGSATPTGNASNGIRVGMCLGFLEGFSAMNAINQVFCPPPGTTMGQNGRVLVKWLTDHPDVLHGQSNALAGFALSEAFPCSHETPVLTIADSRLMLGMSEATARQALQSYRLVESPNRDGGSAITTKNGPPFRLLGSIYFENGLLMSARAERAFQGRRDTDLANALFKIFESRDRLTNCEVSATSSQAHHSASIVHEKSPPA